MGERAWRMEGKVFTEVASDHSEEWSKGSVAQLFSKCRNLALCGTPSWLSQ